MNGVVISHIADLDGISSAAIIMRKFNLKKEDLFFADYNKESINAIKFEVDKKLKKEKGLSLFITDLGVNDSTKNIFVEMINKVKKNSGKVFWFDHHTWDKSSINNIALLCDVAVVGENTEYCAAEITAKELEINDSFTKKLLKIVHIADFNIKKKDKKTDSIIGSYVLSTTYYSSMDKKKRINITRKIAESLSKNILLPDFIVADGKLFGDINRKRLKELSKDLEHFHDIGIGFSKYISTNDGCELVQKETGADIGAYINVDTNKAHLRSKFLDCSELARSFGGGGHPHASAFEIDKKLYNLKNKKSREQIKKEIFKKAETLYKFSKS
ncbi:MAG: hypothetical protein ACP5M9_01150 [Candidatus Micrarchaeia archaeon]